MLEILGITGPIYLAIALGYGATRQGVFAQADMQVFGKFAIHMALPALHLMLCHSAALGKFSTANTSWPMPWARWW